MAAASNTPSAAISPSPTAAQVLTHWNSLPPAEAAQAILPCCGSQAWAAALAAERPIADPAMLLERSDAVWRGLDREAWQQAFDSHPRLGQAHARSASTQSLRWSEQEQARAAPSDALQQANARYEQRFGHIFLLCAAGRSTAEILGALEQRMHNDAAAEWQEAGEQQRIITRLRLERWLGEAQP